MFDGIFKTQEPAISEQNVAGRSLLWWQMSSLIHLLTFAVIDYLEHIFRIEEFFQRADTQRRAVETETPQTCSGPGPEGEGLLSKQL